MKAYERSEKKRTHKPHKGYEANYTNICHTFRRTINTPLVSCVRVREKEREREGNLNQLYRESDSMKTGHDDPGNLIQKVNYRLEMDEICFSIIPVVHVMEDVLLNKKMMKTRKSL